MIVSPPIGGPYAHKPTSVRKVMFLVILALCPATLWGLYLFGWPAINLFLVTMIAALLFEAASLWLARKRVWPFVTDGSALLTAWLLALSLPPWAPWWIGVIGAAIAIIVGKQVFGGLGQNVFNPAMVARVVLLTSFPLEMTIFVAPAPLMTATAPSFLDGLAITFAGGIGVDVVSSASLLGHLNTELARGISVVDAMAGQIDLLHMGLGMMPGSMGETSAVLILLGGLFLLVTRVISWPIPASLLGTLIILSSLFNWIDPSRFADVSVHLLAGATLLGAFFIATDPVTSPATKKGQLIFGAGCGALIFIIRTWAGYPEGVAFAVLLMNAMTPLIDRTVKPRIFGRTRRGDPLKPSRES
ncbi:MAG: RnfABCDGE type electron transport complex subunit D [Fimbriimonadaceae bacterium]|nr:RnfABCDGE type electron transport complex subunit D [Alphaproteobacteria bacterium]